MADFAATISDPGVDLVTWVDSGTAEAPSRLNYDHQHPPTRWRVTAPASFAVQVLLLPGMVPPSGDGSLGGRLIEASWREWSGTAPASIFQAPGNSAVVHVSFTADQRGSHLLGLARLSADSLAKPIFGVRFDVE